MNTEDSNMRNVFAVIMAGGRGERFWPLSRAARPKQLLDIFGGRTLLASAVDRLEGLIPPERIFIITSSDLADASRDAAPSLPEENIIAEPQGRDTAAACSLASELAAKHGGPDAVVVILTADHIMTDVAKFRQTLADASTTAAKTDAIVTIGITPDYPATGFGYIESGSRLETESDTVFRKATRFVEKPDASTASKYISSGNYFWNSGMFIWKASTFLSALKKFEPEIAEKISEISNSIGNADFGSEMSRIYPLIKKISVDYAIMEHADNIVMAEGDFGWDDVGSWNALSNHFAADSSGNVAIGKCESVDSNDNILYTSGGHLIAVCGLNDMVVVHTDDVTMVCPKSQVQRMKELVKAVAKRPDGGMHI